MFVSQAKRHRMEKIMLLYTEKLVKIYKNKKALDDISINIESGQCYGILGKNGAGKSTFIKLILGLIFPSSGTIKIFQKEAGKSNNKIGYLSEDITLYPHLSAKDNLLVSAYSANNSITDSYIEECLLKLSLEKVGSKPVKSFSLGMKRRLQLGMATMTKPLELLILDEPTNGLDVNGCLWLRNYLSQLKLQGVSIVMASHSMADLEACITHYAIFDKGKVIHSGIWNEVEGVSNICIDILPQDKESYINILAENEIKINSTMENRIQVESSVLYKDILQLFTSNGLFPENIVYKKRSLEEIFIKLTEGNR